MWYECKPMYEKYLSEIQNYRRQVWKLLKRQQLNRFCDGAFLYYTIARMSDDEIMMSDSLMEQIRKQTQKFKKEEWF